MSGSRLHALSWRMVAAFALAVAGTSALAKDASEGTARIGVVFARIPVSDLTGPTPAFPGARVLRESLREHGWIDGRNARILWRSAEGDKQRMPSIVDELVREGVDVLALSGNPLIGAARARTRAIPIVMMSSADPVKAGFVASLARPGGNATGMYDEPDTSLNGKRLSLLKQTASHISRVAFLTEVNSITGGATPETKAAADALGLVLLPYGVDTPEQLQAAVERALGQGADAMLVDTALAAAFRDQPAFHALAERHRLPVMHTFQNAVTTGGLMYYGPDSAEAYRRSAFYIDKVLRGASPAELPVQQATKYLLIINLRAARAIGLKVDPALLTLADRVIQ